MAGTTFDAVVRRPGAADDAHWIHPAPATFPMAGWLACGGLVVAAPGLCEAEVLPDGILAVTLLRATGWLSRPDLTTRPGEAGPSLVTPGAQCPGPFEARFSLWRGEPELAPSGARDAELGLRAVAAGDAPLWPRGAPLLEIEPRDVVLSAWKPAESGPGSVVRLLNPTARGLRARLRVGLPFREARLVRLDETGLSNAEGSPAEGRDSGALAATSDRELSLEIPPHALRSILLL
jgi:alpha-mannosidase/mannosylglycerate hydrolase